MEAALLRGARAYDPYGTSTHKQVYLHGSLDLGPTELTRSFGLSWGLGGWLMPRVLAKLGQDVTQQLKQRVARELKTTFATRYAKEISLRELLSLDAIAVYAKQGTGGKYLIRP